MKEIKDKKLINKLIKSFPITAHLSDIGLDFKLYQYEAGEILTQVINNIVQLRFLVEGSISIYAIRYDGTKYPIRYINEFTVLGDIELYENHESQLLTEAKSKVLCLTIQLDKNKDLILNDTIFLNFIIKSLSQKLVRFSESESKFNNFEEKFIEYLKVECPDNMITSVENTLCQLRCSRRQLQRILKKLVEDKVIEKVGRGSYKLIKGD